MKNAIMIFAAVLAMAGSAQAAGAGVDLQDLIRRIEIAPKIEVTCQTTIYHPDGKNENEAPEKSMQGGGVAFFQTAAMNVSSFERNFDFSDFTKYKALFSACTDGHGGEYNAAFFPNQKKIVLGDLKPNSVFKFTEAELKKIEEANANSKSRLRKILSDMNNGGSAK